MTIRLGHYALRLRSLPILVAAGALLPDKVLMQLAIHTLCLCRDKWIALVFTGFTLT